MLEKMERFFTVAYWTNFFNKRDSSTAKVARIAYTATRGFNDDDCSLKASALTFYSILSIVPVLAVGFGIAKGFGFEKHLEQEITHKFLEQPDIAEKLISFAYSALQSAQGGLIAGIGVLVLFWTVLKLFANIESSFNSIWKVTKARSISRKFSDYLAMMIFCPLFFAASSSLSIFIVTQVSSYSHRTGIWNEVGPIISLSFQVFPLIFSWLLFTAIYLIMPNTKVPLSCALIAGVIAGTAFQVVQWLYINFQLGISGYGAIYGSFAALPLFLVWLNVSWIITLAGAEIAYHIENDITRLFSNTSKDHLIVDERVVGMCIIGNCIRAFLKGNPPLFLNQLAHQLGISTSATRKVVQKLLDASILSEVKWHDNGDCYQPARDINGINLKSVCDALDTSRHESYTIASDPQVEKYIQQLEAFDQHFQGTPDNGLLI